MMVSSNLIKIVTPCWRPSTEGDNGSNDTSGKTSGLLWHKDLGFYVNGEFSMAVIQANNIIEDQSRLESGTLGSLETGPRGTFVGIYDGHGGTEASQYVNEHLFKHLQRFASEHHGISPAVIQKAFSATEEGFISLVRKQWHHKPQLASVGSCALVGIVCNGTLYIANIGDSRVVLAKLDRGLKQVFPVQLSSEHNAAIESVRDELRRLHPNDPQIVVLKHKVWRVKGLIQISRSIGDAYLKDAVFNKEPLIAKFRLPEQFYKPILSAEPTIVEHKLCPNDQFLIFASDGLWEHLSNEEAIDIVYQNPRNGIARRLIKAALQGAAKKREMRYSDLKKIDRGVRRHFHDDITVVVLFLDPPHYMSRSSSDDQTLSIRGGGGLTQAGSAS